MKKLIGAGLEIIVGSSLINSIPNFQYKEATQSLMGISLLSKASSLVKWK